jgi:hypothetical protein
LKTALYLCGELIKTRRTEPASAVLCCSGQLRRDRHVEAGVKSDDFTDNSEVAIELTDLATQVGEAIRQYDGILRVVGLEKAIERGLDQGGFCRPTALGCGC